MEIAAWDSVYIKTWQGAMQKGFDKWTSCIFAVWCYRDR